MSLKWYMSLRNVRLLSHYYVFNQVESLILNDFVNLREVFVPTPAEDDLVLNVIGQEAQVLVEEV